MDFTEMTTVDKIAYFKEKQEAIIALQKEAQNKTELNNAEIKNAFGVTFGEQISVLTMVDLIAGIVKDQAQVK